MDKPPQAAEVGEASKLTGKEGNQPPTQETEGGATAPPTDNHQDPQASTSAIAPLQAPTNKPQDPQASTSRDDPDLKEYVDSYMQAAQDWFDNVQESKENAYKTLYNTLLEIGRPHIKGLDKANGHTVLASIADKSGQFISEVDKYTVYVSKDEKSIKKKPVTVS